MDGPKIIKQSLVLWKDWERPEYSAERSNIMTILEALSVVNHRPLVLAGLAAADYVALAILSEGRS